MYGSVPAVAAFELEVFEFLERFVSEEGVECDWYVCHFSFRLSLSVPVSSSSFHLRPCLEQNVFELNPDRTRVSLTGVHAFLSKHMFDLAAAEAEQLQQSHPELAAQLEVVHPSDSGAETLTSLRVPSAQGAIIQKKAASLWPYKLVASILERLIADFPAPRFNLQTNTPVTSLARVEGGPGWVLTTPRGTITARQVLLATNGYTSHLLPAFSDLIVPVRGQIGALVPPKQEAGGPPQPPTKLAHSYVFAADPEPGLVAPRDDYLVQRPVASPSAGTGTGTETGTGAEGGEMIYGGGRRFARGLGVGEWRDDEVERDVARYLRGALCPPLDLSSDDSSITGSRNGRGLGGAGGGCFRGGVGGVV